ncbi:uncharacterized protein P174DRAFT_448126 [Aspergillus novofumigatus IBT 16806]|uniref:Uncharacterized protein n=1 Tax=Aspergillus novofumigatus (strain IBT 16806) TaxID=1392255 RepID=A0A2I1CFC1_ASPN1|nr:uncharacterized protein P174DRAFT_448126 [Aspergillus novofumigatus IBT 16806]PKX96300.1 hypothetical protein P174DRAFT_448126 [Aspergillus novofumigatus IBT 16806]
MGAFTIGVMGSVHRLAASGSLITGVASADQTWHNITSHRSISQPFGTID